MNVSDPYEVLGVHSRASQDEIRDSYRRQVKLHHPDVGGDPEVFRRVQGAWELLGDPASRSSYDFGLVSSRLAAARGSYESAPRGSASPQPSPGGFLPADPVSHRVPVWFWFLFAPLASLAVVYPPAQLIVAPLVGLLAAAVVLSMRFRSRARQSASSPAP